MSHPLFLKIPNEYDQAQVKLLVVGQQTNGWITPVGCGVDKKPLAEPVSYLMGVYEGFCLGKHYRYRRSPFWRAAHYLHHKLNPHGPPYAFLWSNLVRVDVGKRRPEWRVEQAICGTPCNILVKEVELFKPQVVVFFTGPDYDDRMRLTFTNLTLEPVEGVQYRRLARVAHPSLPPNSFRISHPAYLLRSRQWSILCQLAALIDTPRPSQ
jgi:hypothetical protein